MHVIPNFFCSILYEIPKFCQNGNIGFKILTFPEKGGDFFVSLHRLNDKKNIIKESA